MNKSFLLFITLWGSTVRNAIAQESPVSTVTGLNAEESEKQHISTRLVLKVTDRDRAANALIKECEEKGGYYAKRTDTHLQLKMPRESVKPFLVFAGAQGMIADSNFSSQSLSQSLADVGAKLKAREELLGKYFKLLENAGATAVITVEQEVIRLVSEIEELKGRQRMTEHRSEYSDVQISFQFQDKEW